MNLFALLIFSALNFSLIFAGGPKSSQVQLNCDDKIYPGQCLLQGQQKSSCNGYFLLTITFEGINIIQVSTNESFLFFINESNHEIKMCVDDEGNLHVYDESSGVILAEAIQNKPGGNARLTDDGKVVLEAEGKINWPEGKSRALSTLAG